MNIRDHEDGLRTDLGSDALHRASAMGRGVMGALLIVLLCASEVRAQQPLDQTGQPTAPQPPTQAQIDNAAMLDRLLADNNYNELAEKILRPADRSLIAPTLDWAKARILAGTSEIVPLLYARALWLIGSSNPGSVDLKETSASIVVYAMLATYADGVKCADQSAPGHHLDVIMQQYRDQFLFVTRMPDDRRDLLFHLALTIEQRTAPQRQNDIYLCRFGLQEMQHSLQMGPGKEVPTPPGHIGKTVVVPNDPNYQPQFVSRDEWEPKQAAARAKFATMLPALFKRLQDAAAPQSPAQSPTSQPQAPNK